MPAKPITSSKPTAGAETVIKESIPKDKAAKEPAVLEIREPKSEKQVEKPKDSEKAKQEKQAVKAKEPAIANESKTEKKGGKEKLGKKDAPDTQNTPTVAPPKHQDTAKQKDTPKPTETPSPNQTPVGDPLAAGKIELLHDEIVSAMKGAGFRQLARFQSYAANKLDSAAPVHGFGVDRQLPPELVRSFASQSAEGAGRGRGIHPRRCTPSIGDDPSGLARSWPIVAEKLDLRQAEAAGVRRGPFAARGVGGGQAGAGRGPGGLRRRAGAADQERNPANWPHTSIRCWWARTTWDTRSTIAAPAAGCAT